jgi:hypothetical protein
MNQELGTKQKGDEDDDNDAATFSFAGRNRFDAERASQLIPWCGLRVLVWIAICSACLLISFCCVLTF